MIIQSFLVHPSGLRRSCVMSVSSEGDSEDGEWSAWVAGMGRSAAARLTGPARLSTPMARLRRQAMTWGPVPVRTWEAHDLNLPVEPGVRDGRNALVRWAVLLEEVLP